MLTHRAWRFLFFCLQERNHTMKVRRKKSKSLKILKSVVLVLFLSLLFVPDNINRSVIAGIALAGILGSLLFLIVPHLPRIPSPALKRKSAYSSAFVPTVAAFYAVHIPKTCLHIPNLPIQIYPISMASDDAPD